MSLKAIVQRSPSLYMYCILRKIKENIVIILWFQNKCLTLHINSNLLWEALSDRYFGITIYYYPGDHNPRHLHVYAGYEEFTISLAERMIEGKALSSTVKTVNSILDLNMEAIEAEIAKGDRGERMSLISNLIIK